jgi:DNA-binding response OmpR family regulator
MTVPIQPTRCDVLIVDDEVMLGDAIARSLTRSGFNVRTAHSGSSALRLIDSCEPRVAILDHRLPDTTGVELAARLRERLPEVAVILMSGAVSDVDQEQLKKAGIMVFVNKPVPLAPLRQAVQRLLQAKT